VMAYVADVTTKEDRGKGMGIVGAAVGLGFVFGPAIGGVFSKTSLSMPFLIAGFSSLITLLLVIFILKETKKEESAEVGIKKRKSLFASLKQPIAPIYILQWFVSISLAGLEATFAYFADDRAGLGTVELGYIFMIMGVAGAIVQGGFVGIMTKKLGEGMVIKIGITVSAIGFALILTVDSFTTAAI